ncbi:hypothetical protein GOP47_0010451 [Adiantum capillus-veneris]|uniref:Uncharacterized protein n=1 Tax=Adiantum capillus-veneris TaxID=13818 RepID=A0A9D4UUQ8_ADICA|nr:hypothetical protein GOP47_0010451 [Adiantum capillus-veneris]
MASRSSNTQTLIQRFQVRFRQAQPFRLTTLSDKPGLLSKIYVSYLLVYTCSQCHVSSLFAIL